MNNLELGEPVQTDAGLGARHVDYRRGIKVRGIDAGRTLRVEPVGLGHAGFTCAAWFIYLRGVRRGHGGFFLLPRLCVAGF